MMGSGLSSVDEQRGVAEWRAGMRAKGEFRCTACGYGVTVYRSLPACPMCHAEAWERVPWRPYSRSHEQRVGERV
jgi:rubrerythrin